MPGLRPHTKLYDQQARDRLGLAVTRGREAAGYPKRPAFAKASGIGVTSLFKLETGEPVGPAVYEAAARALPGWDEDTPRAILDGSPAPALGSGPDSSLSEPTTVADLPDDEREFMDGLARRDWQGADIAAALDAYRRSKGRAPSDETDRRRNAIPLPHVRETGTK